MFDRNRVDNATANQLAIPAEVTMSDGEVIVGHFIIASSRAFGEVLNGESPFLEFAPFQRDRRYIAKSAIRTVKLMEVPGGRALDAHSPCKANSTRIKRLASSATPNGRKSARPISS